jgi:hypothetical protein
MTGRDPRILAAGTAPTPFTAEEIRHGCPTGRVIVITTEQPTTTTTHREVRFIEGDADGATQRVTPVDPDGAPIGESEVRTTSWTDLQAHASFPAETTTITREVLDTVLGELDCLRYEVDRGDATDTFWFATSLPGMPVRFTQHEQGVLVTTSTVTANRFESAIGG